MAQTKYDLNDLEFAWQMFCSSYDDDEADFWYREWVYINTQLNKGDE